VAAVTTGSFRVAAVTVGSFRVVAATTAISLRVGAAPGQMTLGRMIGEVALMLRLTLGRPPPQTNLVLRPCHKPTDAIPKDHNVVRLCARRLIGGEEVAVLRHYHCQLHLHQMICNVSVVHSSAGHGSAACNIHQLAVGLHHMQKYARFVLSLGHVG
jgi:hypothetical protein